MKKKLRLKWLTISAFALGAITVLPIVATACSSNDSSTSGTDTGGSSGSDTGSSSGSDTGSTTGSDTGGSSGGDTGSTTGTDTGGSSGSDTGSTTSGTTEQSSTDPVYNEPTSYYYATNDNKMEFAGYYGNGTGSMSDMNAIVTKITPNVTDVTNDSTGTWVNSGELPDTTTGNTYARYTLTMDSDFAYVKNFIAITDWYNESSASALSVTLKDGNINYDILSNWDVSLVLNMYSETSYEFVLTIAPKDSDATSSSSSSDVKTYEFTLYTESTFADTFANGNRGAAGNYPVDNLKYTTNSKEMAFAGYYGSGTGSSTDMNAIVTKITPDVTDVTSDSSGTWTSGSENGDTTYTLSTNGTSDNAYQYIENFVENVVSGSGEWKNMESSGALSTVLSTGDVDYSVLSNYTVSLVLDITSDTSYTFTLSIKVDSTKDDSAAVSDYVFTLYTKENYDNAFSGPIYDASGNYKLIASDSTNEMEFAGNSGTGSTNNMNSIVAKITPDVTDVTKDSNTSNGGTGTWSAGVTDNGTTTYTLAKNNDGSSGVDTYQYIENFIGNAATWYNQSSASALDAELNMNNVNYGALSSYSTVTLTLSVTSDTSYIFTLTIGSAKDSSSSISDYVFTLYTNDTFASTFTNGNRGDYGNYPVDNLKYSTTSGQMTFAGYNQDGAGSKDEMNAIVTEITPTITDVTADTSSTVWTPGTDSSGNTTYTLVANSDGSYNNSADTTTTEDTYQYIENFIGVTSNWYNETSASALNAQLASGDVDYSVLSNYDISLVLDTNSSDSSTYTSYTFTLSITSKDSSAAVSSYDFILYTGTDFGTTFTNDNRGAAEVPVDNYSDKYYVDSNNKMSFVGYYGSTNSTSVTTDNFAKIVSAITPAVTDIKNDSSGIWTKVLNSDGSYTYTLQKYNDGSEGVDTYQYIENFMNVNSAYNGWANLDSSSKPSTQLDLSNLNYNVLSNYTISLVISFYSDTSYNFVYTITPKDSTTSYQFTLYTHYTYENTYSS